VSATDVLRSRLNEALRQLTVVEQEHAAAFAPQPLWRPVNGNKPELPHDGEHVITWDGIDYSIGEFADTRGFGPGVTHWMPAPPRPRR